MIKNLRFQDIKMFKGNHSVEFKPLTIFTGANNSGKSTLIKFIQDFIDLSANIKSRDKNIGTYFIDEYKVASMLYDENDSFLTEHQKSLLSDDEIVYSVKNFRINEVGIRSDSLVGHPTSIHFLKNDLIVATYDPLGNHSELGPRNLSEERVRFINYSKIIIHFEKLYTIPLSHLGNKDESSNYRKNLKIIIENEWPDGLFETKINFHSNQLPVFKLNKNNKKDFELILYSEKYSELSNDSYYSIFSIFQQDILNSVEKNQLLHRDYKKVFSYILEFVFEKFILPPLKDLRTIQEHTMFFSAYRGLFINEKESQASVAFKKISKEGLVFDERKRKKGHKWYSEVFRKEEIDFLKKWLKIFEIGENLTIDDKQFEIFRVVLEEGLARYPFELGFGNQQLLPLILGVLSNPDGLCIIEEPESHLHPYLQSQLSDFFVDIVKHKKDMLQQLIIETHSEYLIRKLQYLIAKGVINKNLIALYYIHKANKIPIGCPQIQRMEIRDDGIIKQEFGSGFFDESAHLAMDLLNFKRSN